MKIDRLKLNPKNPRVIKDEKFRQLCQSIEQFPEMMEKRPMVCVTDPVDGKLFPLGGNMRLKALQHLKMDDVPDSWVSLADDWTEEKRAEFTIKDNVSFGEWNFDELSTDWDTDMLADWGVEMPDFGEPEVLEAEEDNFDIPDGGVETDIVLGDLFEIGEHRLLCGDLTQTDTFEMIMRGDLADMVVTDPPYNVAYEGKTKEKLTIQNDSMVNDNFYKFLYDFYSALTIAVKKGGAIYIWHASSEIINFGKAMVDAGWLLKQQLIWVKNTMVMGRQDY